MKTDEDFKKVLCKIKAKELNDISGIELFDSGLPIIPAQQPAKNIFPFSGPFSGPYSGQNNGIAIDNNELLTRKKIREILEKYEREQENIQKELNKIEWQRYKTEQERNNNPDVLALNDWITAKKQKQFENEWLLYKIKQEQAGKNPKFDDWIKNKMIEDTENKIEYIRKQWEAYRANQLVTGSRVEELDSWLKKLVENQRQQQQGQIQIKGGVKKYRKTQNKSKKNKSKKNKSKQNKSKKNKSKKNKSKKTYYNCKKNKTYIIPFDAAKINPASIIL